MLWVRLSHQLFTGQPVALREPELFDGAGGNPFDKAVSDMQCVRALPSSGGG